MFSKLLITIVLTCHIISSLAAPLASQRAHKDGQSASLSLDLPYNPLNGGSVIVQDDKLIVSQISHYDLKSWFSAYFSAQGVFEVDTKLLTVSQDGQLGLATDHLHVETESSIKHDDDIQRHTFSVKGGKLNFNNMDTFTLCPTENEDTYSIHLTYSKSASACGKSSINNAKFKVQNGAGVAVEDFELPEFIFNQGRHVYF